MTHTPPQHPDLATKADLSELEERLEVHLTVFVDERLTGTERWLTAAFQGALAAHSRVVAAAVVAAALVAVVVTLALGGLAGR